MQHRALRAGARLLRRRRAQVRRGRRFRHRPGDDAAVRRRRSRARSRRSSPATGRRARRSSSARAPARSRADLARCARARATRAVPLSHPRGEPRAARAAARDDRSALSAHAATRDVDRRGCRTRIEGVVVMNEVLDAVPPHLVARRDGAWLERGVALDGAPAAARVGGRAARRRVRCDALAAVALSRGRRLRERSQSGGRSAGRARIATRVTGGALLIIDYGFPRARVLPSAAREGTLMAHYRHRAHADPFLVPGSERPDGARRLHRDGRGRRARRPARGRLHVAGRVPAGRGHARSACRGAATRRRRATCAKRPRCSVCCRRLKWASCSK